MPDNPQPAHVAPKASRPNMPGYGILDAESGVGLLPWSYVSEQMTSARNYWVATTRPDGRPHTMPVWGIWFEETFYFSTGPDSRKARNLAKNSNLVVHLESGDETVILEGVAERISETSLLSRLDQAYHTKYQFHLEGSPTFALRPRVAFAWREKDYPGSATRWQF
jgi:general stress protein 26